MCYLTELKLESELSSNNKLVQEQNSKFIKELLGICYKNQACDIEHK